MACSRPHTTILQWLVHWCSTAARASFLKEPHEPQKGCVATSSACLKSRVGLLMICYLLAAGKILFQSLFMSTTIHPFAEASSQALSSLPTCEVRS